uniref:Uncharacterized protein n=1 Tax=Arundo donax TaxID=35708 RepID=A0A0A9H781_ARUDO
MGKTTCSRPTLSGGHNYTSLSIPVANGLATYVALVL